MKKALITSMVLLVAAAGYSQHLSVNAFGGYTFQDRINFGNAYAYINGGGMWGASIEGVNQRGSGLELLYQYQGTNVPAYQYPGNTPLNPGSTSATVSYLMLNFEQYYMANPKIQPYGALGLGAGFFTGSGRSTTNFAWDLKAGIKFKASDAVGIKIGAQLFGAAQATGTAWYYGYPYTTYSTILQFAFTGGLVFDFGGQ